MKRTSTKLLTNQSFEFSKNNKRKKTSFGLINQKRWYSFDCRKFFLLNKVRGVDKKRYINKKDVFISRKYNF